LLVPAGNYRGVLLFFPRAIWRCWSWTTATKDILFFIILIFFLFINYFFYSLLLHLAQLWKDSDWDHPALETIIFLIPFSSSHDVFFYLGPTISFLYAGKNILSCFCDGLLLLLNSIALIGGSGEASKN
jgi:hypothetical protein